MKSLYLILLCQFVLVFKIVHAQSVMVSPATLYFTTAPGSTETKIISIYNRSPKKMAFQLSLADWLRDSVGGHQYYKPDTLQRSCSKITSFNPTYIEIDSGSIGKIEVRMQVPATVSNNSMKWSMLFLQSIPQELRDSSTIFKKQTRASFIPLVRVGIHIYQTPPGAIKKAVEGIKLVTDSAQRGFVYLYFKNTGQVMLDCKAHLELKYLSTGEETITQESIFPVFPDGFRRVQLPLPAGLKSGNYSVLGVLDYGIDVPLEAVQQNITLKNPVK